MAGRREGWGFLDKYLTSCYAAATYTHHILQCMLSSVYLAVSPAVRKSFNVSSPLLLEFCGMMRILRASTGVDHWQWDVVACCSTWLGAVLSTAASVAVVHSCWKTMRTTPTLWDWENRCLPRKPAIQSRSMRLVPVTVRCRPVVLWHLGDETGDQQV